MRAWTFIAVGLIVAVAALLGPPLIQLQKELRAAQARNAELASTVTNLNQELDAANQARTELQGAVEESNSEIEKRQAEVERLNAEVDRLNAELEKAIDLAKHAGASNQQGESDSKPSDPWQPQ